MTLTKHRASLFKYLVEKVLSGSGRIVSKRTGSPYRSGRSPDLVGNVGVDWEGEGDPLMKAPDHVRLAFRNKLKTIPTRGTPSLTLPRATTLKPGCLLIGGHATFLGPPYEAAPLRRAVRLSLFPFRSPFGAPVPGAPPCIRQRLLPFTIGDWQGFPCRVRAPHRDASRSGDGSFVIRCMGLSAIFL
jgi:hypothetical protein